MPAFRTDHDREDHQPHHVVGDGRAENRPRLDARERAQIAEDARGDPDARRRDPGCKEYGDARRDTERAEDRVRECHRRDDADRCDLHRGAPDAAELAKVHVEADLEKQQDGAELAERTDHVLGMDQSEDRRSQHDSCGDLGKDGGLPEPLGELGRHACGEEREG